MVHRGAEAFLTSVASRSVASHFVRIAVLDLKNVAFDAPRAVHTKVKIAHFSARPVWGLCIDLEGVSACVAAQPRAHSVVNDALPISALLLLAVNVNVQLMAIEAGLVPDARR